MRFIAKALYVPFSPFKLRSIVDVIRGKNVKQAIYWLTTHRLKRVEPIKKLVLSAAANAKNLQNLDIDQLVIHSITVDHGPTSDYFKPGAMGRANMQKRRSSHLSIQLADIGKEV